MAWTLHDSNLRGVHPTKKKETPTLKTCVLKGIIPCAKEDLRSYFYFVPCNKTETYHMQKIELEELNKH